MDLAFKGDSIPVATPQVSKLPRNHRQSEHIPVNRYPIFSSLPPPLISSFYRNTRLPVSDPRFLHFLLLPLTWKHKDRFSSKRNAIPLPLLTFRVDLQRNHGFGLPMAVPRYYGIRPRKVEFRVRYFQTILRSFVDQPEVGCVLVVIGLKKTKRAIEIKYGQWLEDYCGRWLIIIQIIISLLRCKCDIKFFSRKI